MINIKYNFKFHFIIAHFNYNFDYIIYISKIQKYKFNESLII